MKPAEISGTQRMKTAATAMASNIKTKAAGGDHISNTVADMDTVNDIISQWSASPRAAAKQTIDSYGPPTEASPSRLIWYNNSPWKRTIVYRDETSHDFPAPHTDMLENVIDYEVPVNKMNDLAGYDGSIVVERTKGEVIARCHEEAANILSLNLMDKIVTGELTTDEARSKQTEIMSAYMADEPAPYAEVLQFDLPSGNTNETDEVTIAGSLAKQVKEKAEQMTDGQ